MAINSHFFITSDNAALHYYEAGEGPTLIMLSGGAFSAEVLLPQIKFFSQNFHVIALDKRGHGKSQQVNYGYNIARFTQDLHELILIRGLNEFHLLGHSLGASMCYRYIDLFTTDKVRKLIIVDEPPVLLINPLWTNVQSCQYGAIYKPVELHELTNQFVNDPYDTKQSVIDAMTTQYISTEKKNFLLSCMDLTGSSIARLYFNNICQDFREVLPKITIPTLFVAGKASIIPWQSHQWMREQVPHATCLIFEENEGGSHFLMLENPEKFNQHIKLFLEN